MTFKSYQKKPFLKRILLLSPVNYAPLDEEVVPFDCVRRRPALLQSWPPLHSPSQCRALANNSVFLVWARGKQFSAMTFQISKC